MTPHYSRRAVAQHRAGKPADPESYDLAPNHGTVRYGNGAPVDPSVPDVTPHRRRGAAVERERALAALAGSEFLPGQRIELHPGTDHWMRGERYGDVVQVQEGLVQVKLDKTCRRRWFVPDALLHVGHAP